MRLPDFTASASLGRSKRTYYGKYQYKFAREGIDQPGQITLSQLEGLENADTTDLVDQFEAGGEEGFEDSEMLDENGVMDEETDLPNETEGQDLDAEELSEED